MKFKPIYAVLILFLGLGLISLKIYNDVRSQAAAQLRIKQNAEAAAIRQRELQQKSIKDFENERRVAQEEREFNQALYGRDTPPPEVVQQKIERTLRKIAESNSK